MKASNPISIVCCTFTIAIACTVKAQVFDSPISASYTRGIFTLSHEIASRPDFVSKRCFATVESDVRMPATELQDRLPPNTKGSEIVESPIRVTFSLRSAGFGAQFEEGKFSAVEWTRAYAARIRNSSFGRSYTDRRIPLLSRPISNGILVSFELGEKKQPPTETTAFIALPKGAIDSFKEALLWRQSETTLFGSETSKDNEALARLRAAIETTNPYRRLVAFFRLDELGKLMEGDVKSFMKSARSTEEAAAASLAILHDAPEYQKLLLVDIDTSPIGSVILDGITLGCAIHFVDLPNSAKLITEARSNQFFGVTGQTELLTSTTSYPLLIHIGKRVQDSQPAKKSAAFIHQILAATSMVNE